MNRAITTAALVLVACVEPATPPPPRPVSEFPVSFVNESDSFYAEEMRLSLDWSQPLSRRTSTSRST